MNGLLVMKIKWSLDINTGAVERSEAARARSLAGATVGGAKYPRIFGMGCKISWGAKYPVTPGSLPRPMSAKPDRQRQFNSHWMWTTAYPQMRNVPGV